MTKDRIENTRFVLQRFEHNYKGFLEDIADIEATKKKWIEKINRERLELITMLMDAGRVIEATNEMKKLIAKDK